MLIHLAAWNQWGARPVWASVVSIVAVLLYGLSDEFHQMFVHGRQADVLDVAADVGGAVTSQILVGSLRLVWRTRTRSGPVK